jgi:hypothetical protein
MLTPRSRAPTQDPYLAGRGFHAYQCESTEELAYIHPSSVLAKQAPEYGLCFLCACMWRARSLTSGLRYVVYTDLVQTPKRLYMKGAA